MDFLVTCPINQFSRATVTLRSGGDASSPDSRVSGIDHSAQNPAGGGLRTLARLEICAGVTSDLIAEVSIANPIPAGKGMGSSSADVAAAVWATGKAAGRERCPPADIAEIALSVEPTDGVMFPGIALFDHRRGRIAESLGPPPPLEVIVIDRGGQVDTLEFNKV